MDEILLIAGTRDLVIVDFAEWSTDRSHGREVVVISDAAVRKEAWDCEAQAIEDFSRTNFLSVYPHKRIAQAVLFLHRNATERDHELLGKVADFVVEQGVERICIVGSFRVHFGDTRAASAEKFLLDRLKGSAAKIVVFRPALIFSPLSWFDSAFWRWRFLAAFAPSRFSTCCVEGEELFAAIQKELETPGSRKRAIYALLGENKSWRELLIRTTRGYPSGILSRAITTIMRVLLIGQMLGLLFELLTRIFPRLRAYHFNTLHPHSTQELLALYNKYNYRHVKIVGYNNGVVHFGHSYPGKTIVSTIRCNRRARVKGDLATFDGGVTIHRAMEVLRNEGKELHVIPNYTYVTLGTGYFIPIHGSASDYSTIGETIEKVLLYDPVQDRFLQAERKDAAFGEYLFNLSVDVLLLRLTVRVKQKSRYFIKVLELPDASSEEILNHFHDKGASNVEVRKAKAASPEAKVSLYYTDSAEGDTAALELPRDRLGSLWDRLEENPITSVLFHGLIRRLAHHVELFLSEAEFAVFWDTHRTLPLSKIQLRYIKRDGMPHSPFRKHDCVSADLFMLKKHKAAFEAYLKEKLPAVALNPGKHSR